MIKNLKQTFKELDQDGNGTLSYEELKLNFDKYYGQNNISKMEFTRIMESIDFNKNNTIEYEEFLPASLNLNTLLSEKYLRIAFNSYDFARTNLLSSSEIKQALGLFGEEVDHQLIPNLIKK